MHRILLVLVAVCCISLFTSVTTFAAEKSTDNWLNSANLDKGQIGISYDMSKGPKLKLIIKKDKSIYTYDLTKSNTLEYFSLQSGNGTYTISIVQNTTGNKYKLIQSKDIILNLKDSNLVFLGSIQNINWQEAKSAVAKAKELTKDESSNEDKVKAIYEYIIHNIDYDTQLAKNVASNYMPNIDSVLKTKKGICYDYAVLFAAMTRSIGIPTKLVMGTSEYVDVYHAWNNVYINGEWITVDTTIDAPLSNKQNGLSMIKDSSKYVAAKVY